MLVQLVKLLSAEGLKQLASRSGRAINTIILPLKKKHRPYMIRCQLPVESSKSTIFATACGHCQRESVSLKPSTVLSLALPVG